MYYLKQYLVYLKRINENKGKSFTTNSMGGVVVTPPMRKTKKGNKMMLEVAIQEIGKIVEKMIKELKEREENEK